jgi:eukaryotic-like serine/threonine-protein kinase
MSEASGTNDDTLAATVPPAAIEATNDEAGARPARDILGRGDVVGRYVVLSKLGAGGMGVVYAAYDPELDRKVALKLLLPAAGGGGDGRDGRARLLREAQALAKLQHPNVVTIHDVGTHDDRVWLAMEFVEGRTLSQWRTETPRRWAEVLDVLVHAGRGVAAAHGADLLHRDLKPDNIMVGTDGRVRVMDFGLARTREEDANEDGEKKEAPMLDSVAHPKLEALELRLTQTGALMGTPVYMAPEQLGSGRLGPATDQFSYCVMLWEALFGTRPFSGSSFVELAVAVLGGKRAPPPRGVRVPTWLRRVLERGLVVEPAQRWPSMDALLEALTRGQEKARLRRAIGVVGALGLCAASFAGWHELDRRSRMAACEAAGSTIAEVWNDDAREELRAALVGTGVSYANVTADKVMPWLDDHATEWQTARTQSCLDAEVHRTWDEDLLGRSLWCLDERRMQLEAMLTELARGNTKAVESAVEAVAGLDRIDPCREQDLLGRMPTPPAEQRDEVRAVRAELSRVNALRSTGAYDEGLTVARAALAGAEVVAWPPLVAEARLALGDLLGRTGAYAEAEEALEAAYFEAAKADAAEVATATAQKLVFTVGVRLARHAEGLRWSRLAEVPLASLPDVAQLQEATSLNNLAGVHYARGSYAEAKVLHERALAIKEQTLGPEHPDIATNLNNLGVVHHATGSHAEAKALFERALAIKEQALGPEHPAVAASLNNLASSHRTTGAYAEAKALHERALAIWEQALGPEHPNVATSLANLANIHEATGSYAEAKALQERALDIREQALGPDHPDVATSLNHLANVYLATGSDAEARALYERALSIWEQVLGPDHPNVATSLSNLAVIHRTTGSYAEAKALHERALAIREQALGPDHPDVASSVAGLGIVHHATGSYAEAEVLHERALAIRERALGPEHPDVASSLAGLGIVHHATGSYAEAEALYERALAIQEQALGSQHPDLASSLVGLARIALARGRAADAIVLAERAVKVVEHGSGPARDVASARFVLARALWDASGRERPRALAVAEQAREAYREAGNAKATELAEVAAWLRAHAAR